jgi:hypothetical protein
MCAVVAGARALRLTGLVDLDGIVLVVAVAVVLVLRGDVVQDYRPAAVVLELDMDPTAVSQRAQRQHRREDGDLDGAQGSGRGQHRSVHLRRDLNGP